MTHSNNASLLRIMEVVLQYYADKISTNFYQRIIKSKFYLRVIPLRAINTIATKKRLKFHHWTTNFILIKGIETKKKKNSILTGRKNRVTFDKGQRWPQALPRYTGHVVGGLLDASPQSGSRARRDNGCTLRTHFETSLYTGEGRRTKVRQER